MAKKEMMMMMRRRKIANCRPVASPPATAKYSKCNKCFILFQANSFLDRYASRLHLDVGPDYCGLRIDSAHPYDHGEWSCHVIADVDSPFSLANIYLHVSNWSQIYISVPPNDNMDLVNDDMIVYEPNGLIEAECTSVGGRPEPEFHW